MIRFPPSIISLSEEDVQFHLKSILARRTQPQLVESFSNLRLDDENNSQGDNHQYDNCNQDKDEDKDKENASDGSASRSNIVAGSEPSFSSSTVISSENAQNCNPTQSHNASFKASAYCYCTSNDGMLDKLADTDIDPIPRPTYDDESWPSKYAAGMDDIDISGSKSLSGGGLAAVSRSHSRSRSRSIPNSPGNMIIANKSRISFPLSLPNSYNIKDNVPVLIRRLASFPGTLHQLQSSTYPVEIPLFLLFKGLSVGSSCGDGIQLQCIKGKLPWSTGKFNFSCESCIFIYYIPYSWLIVSFS